MENRTLADTGLSVSRVALGTMTFGAQVDEAAAVAMINESRDRGINFIDTANVYNSSMAEQILGRALKGRRDGVVLASKVGIRMGEGPTQSGLSCAAIREGIEASLRRLDTDYLDLYYLHQPDPATPLEEGVWSRVVFREFSGGGLLLDSVDEDRPLDDLGQQQRTVQRSPTL